MPRCQIVSDINLNARCSHSETTPLPPGVPAGPFSPAPCPAGSSHRRAFGLSALPPQRPSWGPLCMSGALHLQFVTEKEIDVSAWLLQVAPAISGHWRPRPSHPRHREGSPGLVDDFAQRGRVITGQSCLYGTSGPHPFHADTDVARTFCLRVSPNPESPHPESPAYTGASLR